MVPAPAMTRPPRIRFAFRLADGPAAGLSCGGWRVWTHGESTYITGGSGTASRVPLLTCGGHDPPATGEARLMTRSSRDRRDLTP